MVPAEQMWRLLERYRSRSDRSGQVFSVAVFRSDGSMRAVRRMARVLAGRARLSDEVGWLEGDGVGVILPDTPAGGAECFAASAVRLLEKRCPGVQFTLYTYPTDNLPVDDDEDRSSDDGPGTGERHNHLQGGLAPTRPASRAFNEGRRQHALSPELVSGFAAGLGRSHAAQPLEPWFVRPLPVWKRALDVIGAIFLAVLLSPLLVAAAAAVWLSSPGAIIFRQQRAGLGGRPFMIYKFRTMRVDAEAVKPALRELSEQDGPAFKLHNDPRVTPIGRLLRKSSIDELPQLWNVLKGEMSLVGPRPLPCDESDACTRWQRRRLEVTPGLTCVWQVKGRSRVTFEQWVRMDVAYLTRRTFGGDLKLLLQTVPAVLLRKGAR